MLIIELIKTIMEKVSKSENVIKDKENVDIANNELNIINSIIKDESNLAQIKDKNLISKENIENSIKMYKDTGNEELNENIKDIEQVVEKMETKEKAPEQKKENAPSFSVDAAILTNIKSRIEESFNNHLSELKKSNPSFEPEDKEESEPSENENLIESSSKMTKKNLGLIATHLYYNKYNYWP